MLRPTPLETSLKDSSHSSSGCEEDSTTESSSNASDASFRDLLAQEMKKDMITPLADGQSMSELTTYDGGDGTPAPRGRRSTRLNRIIDQLAQVEDDSTENTPHSTRRRRVFDAKWSSSRMERSALADWFVPAAFSQRREDTKGAPASPQSPLPEFSTSGSAPSTNGFDGYRLGSSSCELFRTKWAGMSFASSAVEELFLMFLYRGRRSFLSLGCATVAAVCLAFSVATDAFEILWVGLFLCLVGVALAGIGSVNFIWFVLSKSYERSDAAKLATAVLYEHFCTAFGCIGTVALSILYYPLAEICMSVGRYDRAVGLHISGASYYTAGDPSVLNSRNEPFLATIVDPCVTSIGPLSLVMPIILAVLLPLRASHSLPVILISPFSTVVLFLWFPVGALSNLWTHLACQLMFCLGAVWIALSSDSVSRRLFREHLLLRANAKKSFRVRADLDRAMEALLPKYVVERMAARRTGLDYTEFAVIAVSQVHDFAAWSTKLLPADVVHVMNALYVTFDEISSRYQVDKMKALGDRYILSSGLQRRLRPTRAYEEKCATSVSTLSREDRQNRECAIRMIRVASLQLSILAQLNVKLDGAPLRLRVAAHCGPLLGAVVGSHSISYDIFGPTLQTALQMVANVPNGLTVCSEPLLLASDGFFDSILLQPCLTFTLAHNSEEVALKMYAVTKKKAKSSEGAAQRADRVASPMADTLSVQPGAPLTTTALHTLGDEVVVDELNRCMANTSVSLSEEDERACKHLDLNAMSLPPEITAKLGVTKKRPVGSGTIADSPSAARCAQSPADLRLANRSSSRLVSEPSALRLPAMQRPATQADPLALSTTSSADEWSVRHPGIPFGANAKAFNTVSFFQQTRYQFLIDSVRVEQARPNAVKLCQPAEVLKKALEDIRAWGEPGPNIISPVLVDEDRASEPSRSDALSVSDATDERRDPRRNNLPPNPLSMDQDHGASLNPLVSFLMPHVIPAEFNDEERSVLVGGGPSQRRQEFGDVGAQQRSGQPFLGDFEQSLVSRFLFGRELFLAVSRETNAMRCRKWFGLVQVYVMPEIETAFDVFQVQTYLTATLRAYVVNCCCFAALFVGALVDIAYRSSPHGRGGHDAISLKTILSGGSSLGTVAVLPLAAAGFMLSVARPLMLRRNTWVADRPDAILLALLVLLTTLGLSLLPESSILTVDLQYLLLYWLLMTGAVLRFWYHAALVCASIAVVVITCQSQRSTGVPSTMYIVFFPVSIGVCVSAYYKESYNRSHYEAWLLSSTLLRAAEDEVAIQRVVQQHMFPRHVLSVVNKICLGTAQPDLVFLQSISDLVTLELRLDSLTALVYKEREEPVAAVDFAERSFFLIESLVLQANENARKRNPQLLGDRAALARVHSCGDTVLYAGPLDDLDDDKEPNDPLNSSASISRTSAPSSTQQRKSSSEKEEWEIEERRSWEAARCVIEVIHGLKVLKRTEAAQLSETSSASQATTPPAGGRALPSSSACVSPLSITAIVCCGSGFGSVLGSRRVTFNIFGVAMRQSSTLLQAAPPGFMGCTDTFKRFFECSGATFPIEGADVVLGVPQQWCMRGSGVVTVLPLIDSVAVARNRGNSFPQSTVPNTPTSQDECAPLQVVVDPDEVQRAQDRFRRVVVDGGIPENLTLLGTSLVVGPFRTECRDREGVCDEMGARPAECEEDPLVTFDLGFSVPWESDVPHAHMYDGEGQTNLLTPVS